jgi:hypothetical protein
MFKFPVKDIQQCPKRLQLPHHLICRREIVRIVTRVAVATNIELAESATVVGPSVTYAALEPNSRNSGH